MKLNKLCIYLTGATAISLTIICYHVESADTANQISSKISASTSSGKRPEEKIRQINSALKSTDESMGIMPSENIEVASVENKLDLTTTPEKTQVAKSALSQSKTSYERQPQIERIPPIEYEVTREETETGFRLTLNRSQLWKTNWYQTLSEIRPSIAFKQGKIVGLKLNNIKEKSLLDSVGIHEEDTLMKINGKDLNNPFTMPQIIAEGIGAGQTKLVVEREGKPVEMEISADDKEMTEISEEEKTKIIAEYAEFSSATKKMVDLTEGASEGLPVDVQNVKSDQKNAASENALVDTLLGYSMSIIEGI